MRKIFALAAAMLLCGCADSGNDEASAAQMAESVFSATAEPEPDKPQQESFGETQDNSETAERELWRSEEFIGGSISGVVEFDNGIIAVNYIVEEYGAEFQYYRLCQNGADITPDDNRGHYRLP